MMAAIMNKSARLMTIKPVIAGTRPGCDTARSGITPETAREPTKVNTMNRMNSRMNRKAHLKNALTVFLFFSPWLAPPMA